MSTPSLTSTPTVTGAKRRTPQQLAAYYAAKAAAAKHRATNAKRQADTRLKVLLGVAALKMNDSELIRRLVSQLSPDDQKAVKDTMQQAGI